ncbi:MAG TPA: hypothetical protein VGY97_00810, partial [Solirubrobacteraceae bacterium]|nr:hypothetical protein [Solirubrobacteraceae bacterium]
SWNEGLAATVRGAAALAFHPYFRSGLSAPVLPRAGATAGAVLGAPARRWSATRAELAQLPPGTRAWMTEWNLFDRQVPVHGTWAQGLAVAAFGLDLLSDPRVTTAENHALVGSAPFGAIFTDVNGLSFGPLAGGAGTGARGARSGRPPVARAGGFTVLDRQPPATVPFTLSASGVAMSQLLLAARGADRAQTLSVSAGTAGGAGRPLSLPGGAPAQQGELFSGPGVPGRRAVSGRREALLINLDARPVRAQVRGIAAGGDSFEQLWGDPALAVTGPGSLHRRGGRLAAAGPNDPGGPAVVLPAYSLTRISG